MWKNLDYCIDLYLIYALTLSIFPGFLSEDTGTHSLGSWWVLITSILRSQLCSSKFSLDNFLMCRFRYVLVLIASYNVWDLVSRYTPLINCLKITSRKGLMAAVLARFVFIPAFYFTAKYGDQGYMIMLTSLLAITNGHLTVCVMTEAPKGYKVGELTSCSTVKDYIIIQFCFVLFSSEWVIMGKCWYFCRDLSRMPWATCSFCFWSRVYSQA